MKITPEEFKKDAMQVRLYELDERCPIGIMQFMAFDPNQIDEVPGEWEMVSKLWKRIK